MRRFPARMQKRQWLIRPMDRRTEELARRLRVSPLCAQVLINRGIATHAEGVSFINPKLADLIEPGRMPGIAAAVERIKRAVKNSESITIYGDYDVDGITAVAILWYMLKLLGAKVDYYIPHRIDEGYGLNASAIESLARGGSDLIITVDCGITAVDAAKVSRKLGLDLIITDHHQLHGQLPEAVGIVHPLLESSYENPDSAGAMVAFKLAWAVADEFKTGDKLEPRLREFLINATMFAAMGTVADVVDLRGENRIITSYGLAALERCSLPGVQALIESAGLAGRALDSLHIGFYLAPMLNAAGRMGHARLAVELLTSDSEIHSMRIAEYLKKQNGQRQRYERRIFKQVCEMITQIGLDHPDRKSIVLGEANWHSGVIGIVAARVVEKFYKPTILINSADEIGHGSGRSVEGFDILGGICACSEHLIDFGGHSMAAGVTIRTEKIEQFAGAFEEYAAKNLKEDDIVAKLTIDAAVGVGELREEVVSQLQSLGPFGRGNPRPVFASRGVRLIAPPRRVGPKGEHLQLAISDRGSTAALRSSVPAEHKTGAARCIGFNMGQLEKKLLEQQCFNVAYQPQINTYNGKGNVEFVLEDIQFE